APAASGATKNRTATTEVIRNHGPNISSKRFTAFPRPDADRPLLDAERIRYSEAANGAILAFIRTSAFGRTLPIERSSPFDPLLPVAFPESGFRASYWITLSACTRMACGNLMPRAVAVFWLTTRSKRVGSY